MKISKSVLAAAASAAVGYSLGSINSAYLLGLRKGYDIRKRGSRNPGGTNTLMVEGPAAGIFVMSFDIMKAFVSVSLCRKLFPAAKASAEIAGTACTLGHMFPAYMQFRGGKGLACMGGTILAFGMMDFTAMLSMSVAILMSKKYLCYVPISTSVIYPVYHGIMSGNWQGAAVLSALALPVFLKHRENLERIYEGKEFRISYLWNKQAELERTGWDKYTDENGNYIPGIEDREE